MRASNDDQETKSPGGTLAELLASLQTASAESEWEASRTALELLATQAEASGHADLAETARDWQRRLDDGEDPPRWAEALSRLEAALAGSLAPPPPTPISSPSAALSQDPELIQAFVVEAREHLAAMEAGLLRLENEPDDRETIHATFRGCHTLKGMAGFLDLATVQELAHEMETLLDKARNQQLAISSGIVDVLLNGLDVLTRQVAAVEALLGGASTDPPAAPPELFGRLRLATSGQLQVEPEQAERPGPVAVAKTTPEEPPGEPVAAVATPLESATSKQGESLYLRVETAKLDHLLDMVGEMVIAQALVRHDPEFQIKDNPRLLRNLTQLTRVTEEVQKIAMATRMVSVDQLFKRVARLVRDLSRKQNKEVDLVVEGADTEIDKTIVEELSDPLMHMVRNSLDHGIESNAQDRVAVGKPARAQIRLRSIRRADHILIEIGDDGRGLNREKILSKALERGLVSADATLTEQETYNLIFEPGFSTADKVTDISGRGVGMDVVRKQIQKLRGRIDIQSAAGQGTTFALRFPLTLAIVDGLVIAVGSETFILPINVVQEMMKPAPGSISTVTARGEMVMVRNQLLPILRLHAIFGLEPTNKALYDALFVIAEQDGRRFALAVDGFLGKQEVVIKNLGEYLRNVPGVAGGAILGDGRVGLILDLEAIYRYWCSGSAGGTNPSPTAVAS